MLRFRTFVHAYCGLCGYVALMRQDETPPEKCPACNDVGGQKWEANRADRLADED